MAIHIDGFEAVSYVLHVAGFEMYAKYFEVEQCSFDNIPDLADDYYTYLQVADHDLVVVKYILNEAYKLFKSYKLDDDNIDDLLNKTAALYPFYKKPTVCATVTSVGNITNVNPGSDSNLEDDEDDLKVDSPIEGKPSADEQRNNNNNNNSDEENDSDDDNNEQTKVVINSESDSEKEEEEDTVDDNEEEKEKKILSLRPIDIMRNNDINKESENDNNNNNINDEDDEYTLAELDSDSEKNNLDSIISKQKEISNNNNKPFKISTDFFNVNNRNINDSSSSDSDVIIPKNNIIKKPRKSQPKRLTIKPETFKSNSIQTPQQQMIESESEDDNEIIISHKRKTENSQQSKKILTTKKENKGKEESTKRKATTKSEDKNTKRIKKDTSTSKVLKEYCHICGVTDAEMFKCKNCKTTFCYTCEFKRKIPCLLSQQKRCCVCTRTCVCERCQNHPRFPVAVNRKLEFPHKPRHGTQIEFEVGDHVFVLWDLFLICEAYIVSKNDNNYYEVKYCDTTEIEVVNKEMIYEYVDYIKGDENDCKCMLCLEYEIRDESDVIVFCEKCNTTVHNGCIGDSIDLSKDYICPGCKYFEEYNIHPKCELCGSSSDLLLPMKNDHNKFIHAYCAYFVCGYCVEKDEVVYNDPKLYDQYKILSCEFCKKKGGCIQCTYKSCANAFHISCGRQKGCVITADEESDPVQKKYYCHSHSVMEAKTNGQRMLKAYKSIKMDGDGYDDRLVEMKICNDIFDKFITCETK